MYRPEGSSSSKYRVRSRQEAKAQEFLLNPKLFSIEIENEW